MKNIKNLFYLLFIGILFASCSENKEEAFDSNTEISEDQDSGIYLKNKIQEVSTQIEKEKKEYGDIESGLSIEILDKGEIITQKKKLLDLTFKLAGLKSGYDATFTGDYTFVNKKDNNGYNMIVAEGYCEIKKVNIQLGLNLSEDNSTNIVQYKLSSLVAVGEIGGSTLICEGCRRGCSPRRRANGDGYCTDCEFKNGSCKKTESL